MMTLNTMVFLVILFCSIIFYCTLQKLDLNKWDKIVRRTHIESNKQQHKKLIQICIPSVPRKNFNSSPPLYLDIVLSSLIKEIESVRSFFNVGIYVMFTGNASTIAGFRKLQENFKMHQEWVEFDQIDQGFEDPLRGWEPNNMNNPENKPGFAVRKQNWDYVNLLRKCALKAKYVMLWEDDFVMCPGSISHIIESLIFSGSTYCRSPKSSWILLKLSSGMNGAIFPSSAALDYANYLFDNLSRLPCDLLLWHDFARYSPHTKRTSKSTNPSMASLHLIYKWLLGHHIGKKSSFRFRNTIAFKSKFGKHLIKNQVCYTINPMWHNSNRNHTNSIIAGCDTEAENLYLDKFEHWIK
jgi:hypothetical protein